MKAIEYIVKKLTERGYTVTELKHEEHTTFKLTGKPVEREEIKNILWNVCMENMFSICENLLIIRHANRI